LLATETELIFWQSEENLLTTKLQQIIFDLNAEFLRRNNSIFIEKLVNFVALMKKYTIIFLLSLLLLLSQYAVNAQCSLCTKTAQQMGEKPAQGLNSGILYLMVMPFILVGFIGFRWWKNNKAIEDQQ
jgi:hypothetical protein